MKKVSGPQYVERRGGRRAGSGRKKSAPVVTYSVDITSDQAALLKEWGGGDISAGLRWLVEAASVFVRLAATHPPSSAKTNTAAPT